MTPATIDAAVRRGAWGDVRDACRTALAAGDEQAGVLHALALACCAEGAFEAAIAPLEGAYARDATPARARNLAMVHAHLGRWRDVLRVLSPVAEHVDARAQAIYLAAALELGDAAPAVARLEAAGTPAASSDRDLLCDYGRALTAVGRLEDAATALLRALDPPEPLARAHDALAALYTVGGCGDRALEHARAYAGYRPDSGYAHLRLAMALSLRGHLAESRTARLRALALGIDAPGDWTSAIHLALCDTHEDGVAVAALASRAVAHIAPRLRRPGPRPAGRLRVGYLSPEFDVPPGSFFLNPLLLHHDRSQIEVFLYDTRRRRDPVPDTRGRLGGHLRPVGWLDDDAVADRIEADGIDVLVELSAHFPDSRIPVLARKPAPVQATLPQCPATTGCRAVDYLFTDRWTSPEGTEPEYVERLHRLEAGCVSYTPPTESPAPRASRGPLTFGLLQRFAKLGPDVWDAIAALLRETPGSELLLHNGDSELSRPESRTCHDLRQECVRRGIDPARLRLVGPQPLVAHLDLLQDIDVALDTWPYSGTTTTCECLWMGVPVVTLAGRTHASRVSAGLLRRCGLDDLVAVDAEGYVAAAARVAADAAWRREAREGLRPLMVAKGLTDGRAFAAGIEAAYAKWVR